MKKKQLSSGFGAITLMCIGAILIAAAAIGWATYHRSHQTPTMARPTSAQEPYTLGGAANDTANWKSYCSPKTNACLQYPSSWHITANDDQTTMLSSDGNIEIDYISPYVHDSEALDFNPLSVTNLGDTSLQLRAVCGTYVQANQPSCAIVNANLLATYPLTPGKVSSLPNALSFMNIPAHTTAAMALRARPTNAIASPAEAQAWLTSNDAKTALRILESLHFR